MTDKELFDSLSEPIRRFIHQKGWTSFRPIQRVAIERILYTDKNYILASRTASGKTEAAFLPIISKTDFSRNGVQVLYISPLIALINDQMNRVEELCHYMDITITKWHGEANNSAKQRLLKAPKGIVLITPESIQAMFDNHPDNVRLLFSSLQYVIIDEIHYFIGSDRGVQLQSLQSRLKQINVNDFVTIGLSATIGDYKQAKVFLSDEENTSVLIDPARKPIEVRFHYYAKETSRFLPEELMNDLYRTTKAHKSLIFPSNRGRVEEVTVRLKSIADNDENNTQQYFSHHASIDRGLREYIEFFAKNSQNTPYTICCTSTLELGVDIGNVDVICQIDATNSVSSLVQRAGRSGRREDMHASLSVYSTTPLSLLRALACWNLHEQGRIESPQAVERPYDILLHQLLSVVKERHEIDEKELIQILHKIPVFASIPSMVIHNIIIHLQNQDNQILELVDGKLIIGVDGEKVVNNRGFYCVFVSHQNMNVYAAGKKIGELQPNPNLKIGKRIFLAAKVWKVDAIDYNKNKIFVVPDNNGEPPRYEGNVADISLLVEQEIFKILHTNDQYSFLDELSNQVLEKEKMHFNQMEGFIIPIEEVRGNVCLYLFFGSKINRTICMLFDMIWIGGADLEDNCLRLPVSKTHLYSSVEKALAFSDDDVKRYLAEMIMMDPSIMKYCSKYAYLLPEYLQTDILLQKYYDLSAARSWLSKVL